MKPSEVSKYLRRIASSINNSKNPDKELVTRSVKRVLVAMSVDLETLVQNGWGDTKELISIWPDGKNEVIFNLKLLDARVNPGGYDLTCEFSQTGGKGKPPVQVPFEISFHGDWEYNCEADNYGKVDGKFAEYLCSKVDAIVRELVKEENIKSILDPSNY